MKLLYYNPHGVQDFIVSLRDAKETFEIELFSNMREFLGYVKRPLVGAEHMAILAPKDKNEMNLLANSHALLLGMNLIVILTPENVKLVNQAHKLMPRVVFTHMPGVEVIVQIINKIKETRTGVKGAA